MLAYLSENADNRIIEALACEGFEIKLLHPFSALCAPTDTHADMLILDVNGQVFKHKDYKIELCANVLEIDEPIGSKYPSDVLLNVAIVGKHAFCNTKHTSKTVLAYLKGNGFSIHHVAQGYAHCSTLIVRYNAIITADTGICSAAQNADIDTLLISEGNISLPPYSYGFIGGASGVTQGEVYFCGSLRSHPDGEQIRAFVKKHGKRVVELLEAPLTDIGGILFI